MKNYLLYFIIIVFFAICNAYKILVVFPYPARSHAYLGDGVVRNLLREGHEVTYISPYILESTSQRLRMIDITIDRKLLPDNIYDFKTLINKEYDVLFSPLTQVLINVMKHAILNEKFQKLLNDPEEQFDAVIAEWILTELPVGYAATFNCPLIWLSAVDTHWYVLKLIDESLNPAYNADFMSYNLPPFTFWERLAELYTQLKILFLKYMYFDAIEKQVYENLFAPIVAKRGRQLPSYYDIKFNASLVLSNSHTSMGTALSLPQNYISVGGYYIEENVEPLPENLKIILDNAKHGVIYFSLGSNMKSKDIPKMIQVNMLKMFSELKQTVLWKFEEDLLETPHNVHIINWAPQHSILAHSNVILFITHGGLLSTTEAIHFGVPIIGIPAFFDQFMNIAKVVKRGIGVKVDLSYNIVTELKTAIEEMLQTSRYAEKAKELSVIYHDRPLSPGKELVYWVRHVIETKGAPHLRSPALHVPFYQKLYLDLLGLVIITLLVIIKLMQYVFSCFTTNKAVCLNITAPYFNDKDSFKQKIKKTS